jgi:hypothetical protein
VLRWLDSKITQWRLWYFRAFRLRSMPRPPDGWFDQMIAEQEARKEQETRKEQEKRQEQRREDLKRLNAGLQDASKQARRRTSTR